VLLDLLNSLKYSRTKGISPNKENCNKEISFFVQDLDII